MIIDTPAHIYSPDEAAYPTRDDPYRPPPGTGDPDHLRIFQEELGLSSAEQSAILGDTAQKLWFDPLN